MVDHGFVYRDLPDDYDYDEMSDEELQQRAEFRKTLWEEVDAAVFWFNRVDVGGRDRKSAMMCAFLHIFHPEMPDEKQRELWMPLRGQG